MEFLTAFFSIFGLIFFAVRGGQHREWLSIDPDNKPWWDKADPIHALAFSVAGLAATGDAYFALALFAAVWLAFSSGWSDYQGAQQGRQTDATEPDGKLKGTWIVDIWIEKYRANHPVLWGIYANILRGGLAGLIVAIACCAFGYWGGLAFIPLGMCMALTVHFSTIVAKNRAENTWTGAAWALNEQYFGAIFWSGLAFLGAVHG